MADSFRYFAYDLNTNTLLAELPLRDVAFDSRLNDSGSISAVIDLGAPAVSAQVAPILGYDGNPFKLYVDRDGVIVWGGEVWTGDYTGSSGVLSIGGKELLDHFAQRTAAADYSDMTYPSGIDPAQLVAQVLADAQSTALCGAGASIGLNVVAPTTALPRIIPGYPIGQHTSVQSILADMANITAAGIGGIDISIQSRWDVNGNPVDTLTVWSPRVGRPAGQTGVIFDLSSGIDYRWPTDGTQAGNTITVVGAGNGAATPTATVVAPGVPIGGLGQAPRLDKVVSFSGIQSQSQISLMAPGVAQQFGLPLSTPTVLVPTGGSQPLGSWIVGDDARLYLSSDPRFPNGKDEYWRIVQHAVTVPNEGLATVQLTFNRPPIY